MTAMSPYYQLLQCKNLREGRKAEVRCISVVRPVPKFSLAKCWIQPRLCRLSIICFFEIKIPVTDLFCNYPLHMMYWWRTLDCELLGKTMSHNFEMLKAHILPLSVSHIFNVAKTEWELVAVEMTEEWDHCPCGQEIKEHCFIQNRITGEKTYVGNVCINRFMEISTGNLFAGLKRIAKNNGANANNDVIEYAFKSGYLFGEIEYNFLKQTKNGRKLSDKQTEWKRKINLRILSHTVVQKRTTR